MTINNNLIKNKTELSLKINKAIIDYIKRNKSTGLIKGVIKTSELLKVAYSCVGITDPLFADEETKFAITKCVKKCLTVLEDVKALKPANVVPHNFVEYLELKKKRDKKEKVISGKSNAYEVAPDFAKKVSALKTNEIIQGSDVLNVKLNNKNVSVLAVKDVDFSKIKFCNSLFNYSNIADYIGCFNEETKKVDFISTAPSRKVFYATNKKHILPEKRDIIDLYYLVNISNYKKMFYGTGYEEDPFESVVNLRNTSDAKPLTTENFRIVM